jgi:glucans biosynthesis protein C
LFYYLKKNESGRFVSGLRKLMSTPVGLLPVFGVFVAEAIILKPYPFERYAMTTHGFVLGMLAFLVGICFMLSGEGFWNMIVKWRWLFLGASIALFAVVRVLFGLRFGKA